MQLSSSITAPSTTALPWCMSQPAHHHPPQGPATVLSPLWTPRANHNAWHIVSTKALFIEWINKQAHVWESCTHWMKRKTKGWNWLSYHLTCFFKVACCLLDTMIIPSTSGMSSRGLESPSCLDMKTVLVLYEFPLMGLPFAQDHGIIPSE